MSKYVIQLDGDAEDFEMSSKKDDGEKETILTIDKNHVNGLAGDAKAYAKSYFEKVLDSMLGK